MTTLPPATMGELLRNLKTNQDEKDRLNQELKDVNRIIDSIETAIMHAMKDSGQVKAADDFISVTLGKKWRAVYDPEKWPAIVKALVDSGHDYLIQRRLTDAKVMELVENGTPLPDGLGVEAFDNLSFRRTG